MITDKFGSLLEELGQQIKTPLKPDKNNACLLKFKTGIQVQLELNERDETVIIVSDLGTLTFGRYRENVFKEALKANGLPPPRSGIFAYSKKNEVLVLCDQIPIDQLSGQKLADYLQLFTQKAELWKTSISRGEVPSFMGNEISFGAAQRTSGMFGLVK